MICQKQVAIAASVARISPGSESVEGVPEIIFSTHAQEHDMEGVRGVYPNHHTTHGDIQQRAHQHDITQRTEILNTCAGA